MLLEPETVAPPLMTDEELARQFARQDAEEFVRLERERKEMESQSLGGVPDLAIDLSTEGAEEYDVEDQGFSPVKASRARAAARKPLKEELGLKKEQEDELCTLCAPCGDPKCRAKCVLPCLGHFMGQCKVKGQACTWSHCEKCLRARKYADWQAKNRNTPPPSDWQLPSAPRRWAIEAMRTNKLATFRVIQNQHRAALAAGSDQYNQYNPDPNVRESDPTLGGIFTGRACHQFDSKLGCLNKYEFGQGLNVQAYRDGNGIMTWSKIHPDARAERP